MLLLLGACLLGLFLYRDLVSSVVDWRILSLSAVCFIADFLLNLNKTKKYDRSTKYCLWIFSVLVALGLAVVNYLGYSEGLQKWNAIKSHLILFNLAALYFAIDGSEKKCKRCSTYWAVRSRGSKVIDSINRYEDVDRVDKTHDRDGRLISTTTRKEQVLVRRDVIQKQFECVHCGDSYSEHSVK